MQCSQATQPYQVGSYTIYYNPMNTLSTHAISSKKASQVKTYINHLYSLIWLNTHPMWDLMHVYSTDTFTQCNLIRATHAFLGLWHI